MASTQEETKCFQGHSVSLVACRLRLVACTVDCWSLFLVTEVDVRFEKPLVDYSSDWSLAQYLYGCYWSLGFRQLNGRTSLSWLQRPDKRPGRLLCLLMCFSWSLAIVMLKDLQRSCRQSLFVHYVLCLVVKDS